MGGAGVAYLAQPQYESVALLQIKLRDSQYLSSELDEIRSRNVLRLVVDKLGLATAWGMDQESAMQLLQSIIQTKPVRGADLVRITVTHADKATACNIATEVSHAYRAYRAEMEAEMAERGLAELTKAVSEHQDKVKEKRKRLNSISQLLLPTHPPKPFPGQEESLTARRELLETEKALQTLEMKLMSEKIQARIPHKSIVIHEEANIPLSPVSPNVPLHLVIGAGIGGVAGLLLALPLMLLAERCFSRRGVA